MIALTILCDEYIDRRKLTEQKNPFDYIVPLPARWVGTIRCSFEEGYFRDVNFFS